MSEEIKKRSPTVPEGEISSGTKQAAHKKLYRNRTMAEVKRSLEYGKDFLDYTDGEGKNVDESTVDAAVDTTYYAGSRLTEYARSYSNKLKSEAERKTNQYSDRLHTSTEKSKQLQKQHIKREYAKAARETERKAKTAGKETGRFGKKIAEDTQSFVSAALEKVGEFIAEHPIGAMLTGLLIILLLAVMCTLNSCGMAFGGISGGSVSASYSAEDTDIRGAEADYAALESDLQQKINNAASLYPGYDEYRFDVDPIEHSAWNLASVLTVLHEDYERSAVQGTVSSLFNAQYTFSTLSAVETRYRTESRTGYYAVGVYDADGNLTGTSYVPYTYYVQVPYEYSILTVKLDNYGLDNVIRGMGLTSDQLELYDYLNMTKGEKDYLF